MTSAHASAIRGNKESQRTFARRRYAYQNSDANRERMKNLHKLATEALIKKANSIDHLRDRFMEKVEMLPDLPGCWLWSGWMRASGYGLIIFKGKHYAAHRASWLIHHGPIPSGAGYHGTCVLHKCDTPSCVRPDHLYLGTNADNVRDRESRARRSPAKGEATGAAKLTEQEVQEIRAYGPDVTHVSLAAQYGVSSVLISKVRRRELWRHVV